MFPQRRLSVIHSIEECRCIPGAPWPTPPTHVLYTSDMFRPLLCIRTALACAALGACTRAPATQASPDAIPVTESATNVRVAPAETPVAPGDCEEAMRRALAKPDLAVDRIPSPLVAKPPALQRPPKSALRKDGSADIKVDVLIDTLGKAD